MLNPNEQLADLKRSSLSKTLPSYWYDPLPRQRTWDTSMEGLVGEEKNILADNLQILHYSRTMPLAHGNRYLTSTAVFLNEVIKLAVSLSIAMWDISRTLPPSTPATVLFEQLYNAVFSGDGWKLAIPAALYTFQNSLQYVGVSNLDAVHFQILYQLKVGGVFMAKD